MLISFKRIVKIGYNNFFRSFGLNFASVFVILAVVCLASSLFIFNSAVNILINQVKEKVDVSVYFVEDAATEDIMAIKSEVAKAPQIKDIEYVPKEKALEQFVEKHKDDPTIMESLNEIGVNPFLASLNIRAWDASQFEQITKLLEGESYQKIIEKVDYYQRKPVIEKVFSITSDINKGGLALSIILGVVAALIAFNTIRIAISNSSEEVSVMRLVGASNWFIRGPFLIQGVFAGLISVIICFIIISSVCYGLDSPIRAIAPDISTFGIFLNNFWILLLIQIATGIGLGAISSGIAVRKYLKV